MRGYYKDVLYDLGTYRKMGENKPALYYFDSSDLSELLPLKKYVSNTYGKSVDIFFASRYNNSTRQATACVCQSVEVRECAGRHCLMELSGGVV